MRRKRRVSVGRVRERGVDTACSSAVGRPRSGGMAARVITDISLLIPFDEHALGLACSSSRRSRGPLNSIKCSHGVNQWFSIIRPASSRSLDGLRSHGTFDGRSLLVFVGDVTRASCIIFFANIVVTGKEMNRACGGHGVRGRRFAVNSLGALRAHHAFGEFRVSSYRDCDCRVPLVSTPKHSAACPNDTSVLKI